MLCWIRGLWLFGSGTVIGVREPSVAIVIFRWVVSSRQKCLRLCYGGMLSQIQSTQHTAASNTHTQTPWCVKYIEHLTLIIKNIAFWYQKLLAALINWEHSFSELFSVYKIVTWGFRSSVPPPSLRHTLYHSLSSILFTFRGWLVCVCVPFAHCFSSLFKMLIKFRSSPDGNAQVIKQT